MSDSPYYDDLENRDPDAREAAVFASLPGQIAHAKAKAPYFAEILADVDPDSLTGREALAALPVTRKSALIERQKSDPPFGGLAAVGPSDFVRIFASPGPIYEPQGRRPDYWRFARSLYAAGVRPGELLHNCFAYHFTPAGAMVESAAEALGCPVFPGGVGNTEAQIRAVADLKPAVFVGTPSFLQSILDKGEEMGADLTSLSKGLVGGEALLPSLRDEFAGRGVAVLQNYATAELGLIAYESPAREGMILDEGVIVEIVTPGTGDPVADGAVGEVVVTVLTPEYPLIRFATGDLSAVMAGISPCGRSNTRIKGWMGRADQTTKVKGMFVHPEQIAEVVARFPAITKGRLVVEAENGGDVMTLHYEAAAEVDGLSEALQAVCRLKGRVAHATTGSLADDGKVIDDCRPVG
ncbi:MAG: AMP-binding protein [Pseudomonadota bacterium]|nr:AMP-binding protein [Pseudomonadota bacterium]